MIIRVEIKNNFGNRAIYPVNDDAKLFARLSGTKTLTDGAIDIIKELGYQIIVEQQTVTL